MVVKREQYVDSLVGSMHNGLIKVVTGIRRCGKSFLLNELFRKRLQEMEDQRRQYAFPQNGGLAQSLCFRVPLALAGNRQ